MNSFQTKPMSNINIELLKSASRSDLIALYKEAGWWDVSYDEHPEFVDKIIENSFLFAGVLKNKKMIGMGRALSDGVSDAYIQDIVVLKKYRKRGIGNKIVKILIKELEKNGIDWIGVVAQPGTTSFYKNIGFDLLKGHTPMRYRGNLDV